MDLFLKENSFSLSKNKKKKYFKKYFSKITNFHYKNCMLYRKILKNSFYNPKKNI